MLVLLLLGAKLLVAPVAGIFVARWIYGSHKQIGVNRGLATAGFGVYALGWVVFFLVIVTQGGKRGEAAAVVVLLLSPPALMAVAATIVAGSVPSGARWRVLQGMPAIAWRRDGASFPVTILEPQGHQAMVQFGDGTRMWVDTLSLQEPQAGPNSH